MQANVLLIGLAVMMAAGPVQAAPAPTPEPAVWLAQREGARGPGRWERLPPEEQGRMREELRERLRELPPELREQRRREWMEQWGGRAQRDCPYGEERCAREDDGRGYGRGYERRFEPQERAGRR
ncbi:MAG: hypothetical protein N2Z63_02650 [Thiobacillaceae bacterium]|nr:hypothetical protein [Thiobacillaceae bacterium]